MNSNDLAYMEVAVSHAREAYADGYSPVGAVLVGKGLLSYASSTREIGNVLHAEYQLLSQRQASGYEGMTMYTTLEPCLMCSGMAIVGKIDRVVYLLSDYWGGGDLNISKDTPYMQTRKTVFNQLPLSTREAIDMHTECLDMWKNYLVRTGHSWAVRQMLGVEL